MVRSFAAAVLMAAVAWVSPPDVTSAFSCAADLGVGLKSRRKFCDLIISTNAKDGAMMAIPPHAGQTTLMFDLHNRYTPPPAGASPAQVYAKHTAIVSILDQAGIELSKAAVVRELRGDVDIFDRVAGGVGPGGAIAVAPGRAEAIVLRLPESVSAVAVVGVSLEIMSVAEQGTFTTAGRPVAIGSNFRIEYTRR
ncbi:MAG: hypothetical protein ABIP90_06065 [Vicinamibacterales bacterium]